MSSKILKPVIWVLLSSFSLGLMGCDRFLNRNKDVTNDAEAVKIEFKDGACLKEVPAQFQKFLSDEDGLSTSFGCVQAALKSFMKLTRGAQPDLYKNTELQDFFNTYLLKENKVSKEFLADIMKLKVLTVGGAPETVTRTEMEKFVEFLAGLETELGKFRGRMKLIGFKADPAKVKSEEIQKLKADMTVMVDFVLKNTKLEASNYHWSDFLTFIGHLHEFIGEYKDLDELLKWIPLIDSGKVLFTGDNTRLLTQKDWMEMKTWLVGTYITVLRFRYEIQKTAFNQPSEWVTLLSWLDDVFVTLETAPIMKEKKIYESKAVDKLLEELFKKKIFDMKLGVDLIKQTYIKILAYFVEPNPANADPVKIKGLTEDHLKVLKAEYNVWKATQIFTNRIYLQEANQTLESLQNRFRTFTTDQANWAGFPSIPTLDRPEYDQAWQDFYELLSAKEALKFSSQLKLVVTYSDAKSQVPFVGMNMLGAVRSLSRLALRGYGDKENKMIFKRRISKKRMNDLEENFREFGRAIGFFDPDKTTAGKDTFDQANLLVFHSNGDLWVDSRELTQVLAFLISGGKTMLDEIYEDLGQRNCLLPEMDVFKRAWVDEVCFVRELRVQLANYLNNLPGSVKFLNGLSDSQFLQAYKSMVKVASSPRHRAGRLESGEIRTIATLIHFIEAIAAVYDNNRSGILSQEEVESAFPRFEALVEEQALKDNAFATLFLDDIFLYLVYAGKKPPGGLEGVVEIGAINVKKNLGTLGNVDKLMILTLIGVMKESMATSNAQPTALKK
jgi:hypothetical protein